MNVVLETKHLTKAYKSFKALDDVSITIYEGDIYGLVGENGAGKTTLIRAVSGLIFPTSGSYELGGVDYKDPKISKVKERMAAIVESPALYLNMNAYNNMVMQAQLIGDVDPKDIDTILNDVGLGYLINSKKKAKDFSLGMKQRLAIAMALLNKPKFLILDEPMNGLDPEGIIEVRNLILNLNKTQKITFLISSHILEELAKVCNRYGFIHKGKLIQEIDAKDISTFSEEHLKVKLNDNEKGYELLKKDYQKVEQRDNYIYVFGTVDVNEIIEKLRKENLNILEIATEKPSIEDIYLKIIGGKNV
ncbi:MAG TPA: ABC transporter ATP-binding protein [Acholeplasma sp.]|jgi:ABC-2 type transport system ATP-binding protein|nr:ABC transporter ATP-binding protein [Acholeplasma sp.]